MEVHRKARNIGSLYGKTKDNAKESKAFYSNARSIGYCRHCCLKSLMHTSSSPLPVSDDGRITGRGSEMSALKSGVVKCHADFVSLY